MSSRRDNLAALTPYVNDGANRYDFAIAGIPFYSAAQDNIPYQRQTSQFRKDQIDMAITPGEQSLQGWWYRSQNSFHLGAGIEYNDTLHDDNIKLRFTASCNVDVFSEPGKVKLLPRLMRVAANQPLNPEGNFLGEFPVDFSSQWRQIVPANPIANTEAITETGTTFAFYGIRRDKRISDGYTYDRLFGIFGAQQPLDSRHEEIIYWSEGDPVQPKVKSVTALANGAILATTSGLYQRSQTPGSTAYYRRFTNVFDTIAIVKDRLILTQGPHIWEVVAAPTTDPAVSTLLPGETHDSWVYSHLDSTWKWVAITEGPSAIYVAGSPNGAASTAQNPHDLSHAAASTIYQIGLTQENANTPPILKTPTTVAILPGGEYIRSMFCYMGTYLAIGTTAGIRIALMASDGSIGVGPLSCTTQTPVQHIVAYQNFLWCTGQPTQRLSRGSKRWQNSAMTLIKLDLSKEVAQNTLMFPWSEDQVYPSPLSAAADNAGNRPRIFGLEIIPDASVNLGSDEMGDSPYVSVNAFRGPRVAVSFQLDVSDDAWREAYGSPEDTAALVALDTGGIWLTDNNNSRGEGALQTGRIRFDTSENKIFQYLRVAAQDALSTATGFESIDIYWNDSDGGSGLLASIDTPGGDLNWGVGPSTYEFDGSDATPHAWVHYTFVLKGPVYNALDNVFANPTGAPHFLGYQAKAQPANVRQRIIQVPLMMAQREAGPHGRIVERSVQERLRKLEQAEELNAVVLFQDFGTGETRPVIIEQLQFTTNFIPETRQTKAEKPGLLIVTLRTINTSTHDNNIGA